MADLKLSDSPNVDTGYVVQDDDKQNKVQLVANLPADDIELPDSPNSDSGYVTVDGKKHKVKLTAVMYGGDEDSLKKSETMMQTLSGPLSVTDEICLVDGEDQTAKYSLAIVAGTPTETAEEMDIIGNRKYDILPTTDDATAYTDLNPKSMITKGQVASAISTKADTTIVNSKLATKATKSTDFMTAITSTNKGATKTEIDALDDKIDIAGTSGKIIGSYWFGKTKASTVVPAPTLVGQNYYDFTTGQVYKSTDGATWTLDGTNTPPTDIDAQVIISSKFWDITEQENQHGGKAWWSHTNSEWSYSPTIYEDKPAGGASLPLLTPIWSDHKLNDVSYLNADTFSWQSGAVYEVVYQYLVDSLSTAGAVQTETIAGTTISYKVASDGHRICLPDQESAISELYAKTGVAWFYILDTENARFKLPRTKWGFTGLRDAVGRYVAPGLPNITSGFANVMAWYGDNPTWEQGSLRKTDSLNASMSKSGPWDYSGATKLNASIENSIYGNSTTVQPPATQMYLYFYVGNFTQTALENTAGLNAELFNNKADLNLMNVTANVDDVIESQLPTSANNYTWYRKYKSGWVEQGGRVLPGLTNTINIALPITMASSIYTAIAIPEVSAANMEPYSLVKNETPTTPSAVSFTKYLGNEQTANNFAVNWQVSGMAA